MSYTFYFHIFIFKKRGISPRMEMATPEHFRSFWTLLYFLLHFAASCISISDDIISHGTYYPPVFWIRAESNEGVSQVGAILTALHIHVVWVWSAWGMVLLKLYWVGQKTPHCPLQRLPLCFRFPSTHKLYVHRQLHKSPHSRTLITRKWTFLLRGSCCMLKCRIFCLFFLWGWGV